jgi:hypothetical protein
MTWLCRDGLHLHCDGAHYEVGDLGAARCECRCHVTGPPRQRRRRAGGGAGNS